MLSWRRSSFGVASCALALLQPRAAFATYSIAAADTSSQEVGGAITSCVGSLDVGIVYGSLPGVGVVHAQAQLDQRSRGKNRALEMLMDGIQPAEIIAQITRPEIDQSFASRQYGIVDLSGRAAGYTGQQAQAYKNDQQGAFGTLAYSVQGNILTSQAVLDQATEAFREPACDLAERLMRALEAGAENGEGDSRCTGDGIPSDSAFIEVDRPGQREPYLRLSIAGTRPDSPLPRLRDMFDAWRVTHPCAALAPAAGSGSAGMTGAGGAGMSGAGAAAGTGASVAGAGAGGSGGAVATRSPPLAGAGGSAGRAVSTATSSTLPVATSGGAQSVSQPATAAASGTPVPASNTVAQQPPTRSGGCALTPAQQGSGAGWIAATSLLGLARRVRRRRSVRR